MPPVAGAMGVLFFLRRRQKKMRPPMRARPTRGPMTAPAIHALLFFSSAGGGGGGMMVGLLVGVTRADLEDGVLAADGIPDEDPGGVQLA
jgi:predicted lipid-binding transport protein (Tim44 family)